MPYPQFHDEPVDFLTETPDERERRLYGYDPNEERELMREGYAPYSDFGRHEPR